jgi:hypothetical protein
MQEIALVSGGAEFHIGSDGWSVDFNDGEVGDVYDWAVDQMTDFFEWWDPAGYYSRS